jgi:hypothetical protein
MSDRYYLLRNNRESGPFSLGELLQQCLLPGDLLWVEGKSQNWAPPSELPEVDSALPKGYSLSPSQKPSGTVQEHISDRELALRAEGIRRRAMAALYQQQVPLHQGTPRIEIPTGPVYLREEDAVEVIQHKPTSNRSNIAEFMLFCTLSTLVVLGWRGGFFSNLIQVRPQEATVANRLVNESSNAGFAIPHPQQKALILPQATAAAPTGVTAGSDSTSGSTLAVLPKPRPAGASALVRKDTRPDSGTLNSVLTARPESLSVATSEPLRETAKPVNTRETAKSANNNVAANNAGTSTDKVEKTDRTTDKDVAVKEPEKKPEVVADAKEDKHKSFGQVLRGIFKKKKKDDAPVDSAAANGG